MAHPNKTGACEKAKDWQTAIHLLATMRALRVNPNVIACSASVQWTICRQFPCRVFWTNTPHFPRFWTLSFWEDHVTLCGQSTQELRPGCDCTFIWPSKMAGGHASNKVDDIQKVLDSNSNPLVCSGGTTVIPMNGGTFLVVFPSLQLSFE